MKQIISLLALMAVAYSALAAGFVQGPNGYPLLTAHNNQTNFAYALPGSTVTNIPVASANIVPVGVNGASFVVVVGGTNSAQVTNVTVVLEPVFVLGGRTNVPVNQTWTLSAILASGNTWMSNVVATSPNFGNLIGARVKSIQNTNTETLWLTNGAGIVR